MRELEKEIEDSRDEVKSLNKVLESSENAIQHKDCEISTLNNELKENNKKLMVV